MFVARIFGIMSRIVRNFRRAFLGTVMPTGTSSFEITGSILIRPDLFYISIDIRQEFAYKADIGNLVPYSKCAT